MTSQRTAVAEVAETKSLLAVQEEKNRSAANDSAANVQRSAEGLVRRRNPAAQRQLRLANRSTPHAASGNAEKIHLRHVFSFHLVER